MKNNSRKSGVFKYSLLFTALAAAQALAANEQPKEIEQEEEIEKIIVTGSRIVNAAPTSQVIAIDREDIQARGFSSVEDILNSLPQNFSGMSSATTTSNGSETAGADISNTSRFAGQASADLRGLGRSNVLVLVNGRRQAVSAAAEVSSQTETGVNLNSIPFAAIERVEIVLDGASSVYGADAIGGVINIILRKDYEGGDIAVRYDDGANGGDTITIDGSYGYSWDSGNVTFSFSHKTQDPISAAKAGFTTQDFTSLGGFDGRNQFSGEQVGIYRTVVHPRFGPFPSLIGYLPENDNGSQPLTVEDLSYASGRLERTLTGLHDKAPLYFTNERENTGFVLSFEQSFLDGSLKLYSDIQYNKDESWGQSVPDPRLVRFPIVSLGGRVEIPPSNAFNDSGETLLVQGNYPVDSVGLTSNDDTKTSDRRVGLVIGSEYQLSKNWSLDASYQFNETESEFTQELWLFDLEKLQLLANSDDANVAFNPFGNHSAQNDLSSALTNEPTPDSVQQPSISTLNTLFVSAEGLLTSWSGGDIRMAVGGELRKESLEFDDVYLIGGGIVGVLSDSKPERDVKAAFAEINVPVFGHKNSIAGFYSLDFKFAGRYDQYKASDSSAGVDNTYEKFSPSIGFSWQPIEDLKVRGNWGKAFRAPNLSQLYKTDSREFLIAGDAFAQSDPYYPEGAEIGDAPSVTLIQGANSELAGEVSESFSVGVDWFPIALEGFSLGINYNKTEISDQISDSNAIYTNREYWEANYGPTGPNDAIVRDDNGFISVMNTYPINIDGIKADSLDFDLGYEWGDFNLALKATKTLSTVKFILDEELTYSGTDRGLPEWAGTAVFNWELDDLSTTIAVNYTGSYHNIAGVASTLNGGRKSFKDAQADGDFERMDSYITVDATLRYYWSDITFTAGVKDLFEEDKPFYNNGRGAPFDSRKVNIQGRTFFLNIKKEFEF